MALHLTKIAFGCDSLAVLAARIDARAAAGDEMQLTTRYLPKRHAEMAGGSLYWIVRHQLVARSPLIGFGEAEGGRTAIRLESRLIAVMPSPKRAHQGWRYLAGEAAPADLGGGHCGVAALPAGLASTLADLALL